MYEQEVVAVYKAFQKNKVLYPLEEEVLRKAVDLDQEKLRQYCQLFECDVNEVNKWLKQFQEQVDVTAPQIEELMDIFRRIVFLPLTSDSMKLLLDLVKELSDFYLANYVELQRPEFLDNLLKRIDSELVNAIDNITKLVRVQLNRLERERGRGGM